MKRIHVVGSSPRTGTTLLCELLAIGFEVERFGRHERSIFKPAPRNCEVFLSKDPRDIHVVGRLLALDPDLFVLHMVRDPRDVVVSLHRRNPGAYWTNLGVWHRNRRSARRTEGAPRFLTLRYEDLVADPDAVQDEIARALPFLKRRAPFSSFHEEAAPPDDAVAALGGVRPVEERGVGAWRRHLPRVAAQLARHGAIDRDLRELGYESDDAWKQALAGVVPENGPGHLPETLSPRERLHRWWERRRGVARYRRMLRGEASGRRRRRRPRTRRVPADPGPFEVGVIRFGEVQLEVGVLGEGPNVLLLAGLGLPGTEEFDVLGPALAEAGFRALAPNPRGVGRSRGSLSDLTLHDFARDASLVIEHFGSDAHVVGRAYGNRVARCLSADAPDRVRSLTLLAAGGRTPPLDGASRPAPGEAPPIRRWPRVRRAQKAAAKRTPLSEWWDGGSAPTLVIQGLDDPIAPPENGRHLAREHPDRVRLLELEGADHDLLRLCSDRVVPAVIDFLLEREREEPGGSRGAPGGE